MPFAQPPMQLRHERDWGQVAATCTCAQLRSNVPSWHLWPWECGYAAGHCKPFLVHGGGAFKQVLRDLGIGLGLWFAAIIVVSVLGGHGGPPDRSIAFLLPQTPNEMTLWVMVSILAGIGEEAI